MSSNGHMGADVASTGISIGRTFHDSIQSGGQRRICFGRGENAWMLSSHPGLTPASSTVLSSGSCSAFDVLVLADVLVRLAPDVACRVSADRSVPAGVVPEKSNGDMRGHDGSDFLEVSAPTTHQIYDSGESKAPTIRDDGMPAQDTTSGSRARVAATYSRHRSRCRSCA